MNADLVSSDETSSIPDTPYSTLNFPSDSTYSTTPNPITTELKSSLLDWYWYLSIDVPPPTIRLLHQIPPW